MPGVDYLAFRQSYRNSLIHSPKGTTWKDHKYIKKENGRYIYSIKDKAKEVIDHIDYGPVGNTYRNIKYGVQDIIEEISEEVKDKAGEILESLLKRRAKNIIEEKMDNLSDVGEDFMYIGYSFLRKIF